MVRRCCRFEVGVVATQDTLPRMRDGFACRIERIQVRPLTVTASVKNIVDFTESERRNEIHPKPRLILQPLIETADESLYSQECIKIYVYHAIMIPPVPADRAA